MVHHITQRTAAHVGWLDRGVLAPGYLADINVIDMGALAAHPPSIVRDLPAGGRRLMQTASGYRHTFKGGVETFADGEHTGAMPGGLVRGARSPAHELTPFASARHGRGTGRLATGTAPIQAFRPSVTAADPPRRWLTATVTCAPGSARTVQSTSTRSGVPSTIPEKRAAERPSS